MESFATIILAAGQGTRMKSATPKVLHKIMGKTILEHVNHSSSFKNNLKICVVSKNNKEAIKKIMGKDVLLATQINQHGTGDAVKSALPILTKQKIKTVLIMPGDMPLLKQSTIKELIKKHKKSKATISMLTGTITQPKGYGRIIRDNKNKIKAIIEEKDLKQSEKAIQEVNTGVYIFDVSLLKKALSKVKSNNAQKEYYLTDTIEIIALMKKNQHNILSINIDFSDECLGINSKAQLAEAIQKMRMRKLFSLMDDGVTIEDPASTFIDLDVKIGQDTTIKPFSIITGDVTIGKNCEIGPFAHIREGVTLANKACIGNFVEVKKSYIGENTKAKHLSYLGNAILGKKVNIGAGTITANYDGYNKHQTIIGNGCKIGSNTVIIAPNKLGNNVTTGSGTIIPARKKIPDNSILYGVPAEIFKNT